MVSVSGHNSTIDVVFVGASLLLFLFNLFRAARSVVRGGCCNICRLPRDLSSLWRFLGLRDDEDELVSKGLAAASQRGLADACSILLVAHILAMVLVFANIVGDNPRWMTDGQTVCLLGAIAFLTLGTTCLNKCLSNMPRTLHGVIMMIQLALNIQCEGFLGALASETCTFLFRFMVGMKYPRVCEVTLWNLAFVVISTPVITGKLSDPFQAQTMVLFKMWLTGIVIVLSITATKSSTEKIRADLDAARLRDQTSGLSTLLDLVCDVVVTLDENLRIRDKASRFSAMVMLQGKSVEGLRLQDYMPEAEDREKLERSTSELQADPAEAPASRAVHVKLRDSMGNIIAVELFCVQTQTLAGKTHFVGIREFSDFAAEVPECKSFAQPVPRRVRHRRSREGRRRQGDAGLDRKDRSRDKDGSSSDSNTTRSSAKAAKGDQTADEEAQGRGEDDRSSTSAEAVQLALLRVMEMCSVGGTGTTAAATPIGAAMCCPLHRRTSLLRKSLEDLDAMPCAPEFGPTGELHPCEVCGLLPEASGAKSCFACGAAATPKVSIAL